MALEYDNLPRDLKTFVISKKKATNIYNHDYLFGYDGKFNDSV